MRNNFLFLREKTVSAAFVAVLALFAACDKGIDADETFTSDVTNAQLESPKAEDVKITISPDGATMIAAWPVVHGAGGYEFTLYNVDDPANPKVVGTENEVVDGCTVTRSIESDTQYEVHVRTLGNEKYNNTAAESATTKAHSTLAPTDVTFEEGGDINAWLAGITIPVGKEFIIDLVGGKEYTVSDVIDFENRNVTIRGVKMNHAKIKMTGNACFLTNNGFKLKFADIDCSEKESEMLFGCSKEPDPSTLTAKESMYVVANPILLQGCNVTDLKKSLFFDNNKKYCVEFIGINDCFIQTHQDKETFYADKSTFVRMDIVKSTFSSTVQSNKNFIRMNGPRPEKMDYPGGEVNIKNSTLYNMANKQNFVDWRNFRGQTTNALNMESTIFAECGKGNITALIPQHYFRFVFLNT